jgi:putative acetyltransferase
MNIRPEKAADRQAIHDMTVAAFGGEAEALLVDLIRTSPQYVPGLSLVAEDDGLIVGHVMFSHVMLHGETETEVLSLAPLTVHPDHQGRGVGTALVLAGITAVRQAGEPIVVLEGHPDYYPRFGFQQAVPLGIDKPAHHVPDEAFMVLFVDEGARGTTGKLVYPPAFRKAGAIGPEAPG